MREQALYETPEVLEKVVVLDDSFLEPYNETLENLNPNAQRTLGKFESRNGELAGSSPLMGVQLENSGFLPEGMRLSPREDLEKAISLDESGAFLRGNYTRFGVALRTEGDSYKPNNASAKNLATQLKGKNIKLGSGLLIPFSALEIQESQDSDYGLILNVSQEILDKSPEEIRETISDLESHRWDYARNEGLSCASLYSDGHWGSSDDRLDNSVVSGRVVGTRAAGSRKIFEEQLASYKTDVENAERDYHEKLTELRSKIDKVLSK